MKKTETIALYREEFLAGRSEEARRQFDEKDVARQYASIIAWRRRREKAATKSDALSPAAIIETLRKIKSAISELPSLNPAEAEKMIGVVGEISSDIHNFERIKKNRLLRELESEQERLNREREGLQQKIDSLRQELNWQ